MASTITVVGTAPYPTALPEGRHLSPGEVTKTLDSPEVRSLEKLGLLHVVPSIVVPDEEKQPVETNQKPRNTKQSSPSSPEESE